MHIVSIIATLELEGAIVMQLYIWENNWIISTEYNCAVQIAAQIYFTRRFKSRLEDKGEKDEMLFWALAHYEL